MQIHDGRPHGRKGHTAGVFPVPLQEFQLLRALYTAERTPDIKISGAALLSYLKAIIFSTYKNARSRIT
ncbi:hypothetical protein [Rhizobium azibense]|uniref:hypothetical protein n=1 Tax=Rhizobium azibense TaxID=1136135 RepID=UPI0010493698|nr:hypothetical protein [Rhizobium azibense]